MRFFFLISLFLCFVVLTSTAQDKTKLTATNADCSGIIDLLANDTVFGPTTAPMGFGAEMEISGEKNSLSAFEKEHNTVWYRFRVPYNCVLTFDVIPLNKNDDYDFILYKFSGKNFCSDIINKSIKPVRTCISRFDPALGSCTGLKLDATDEFIHSGQGSSYCKALDVKKGEIYVLVLDNVYPNGSGHTVKIHYSKPSVPVQQIIVAEKTSLAVTIIDKETHDLVKATARIFNKKIKNSPAAFTYDSITSLTSSLNLNSSYTLKIEAPEYFDYSKEINTLASAENLNITAELDRIVVGKNVVFEDILFYGNEARFLPESVPVLENFASTMKKNPNLVIEIHGHVNCPTTWEYCQGSKIEELNMILSINRAKAVYDYLMETGVDPSRMKYIGFGATKMIFPDARSEEKMKQNRRVEVAIISN